jgi:cell division transport system permease protein
MIDLSSGTTRRARRGMLREWRLHALSIFSLAVAFVCLGSALLVVTNLDAIRERWEHAGRASIYLKDSASSDEVSALKDALAKVPAISGVRYESSGQARTDFAAEGISSETSTPSGQNDHGDLSALAVEAFPASLEITVKPETTDAELTDIVTKVKMLPGVDDVETYQAWTERLAKLVKGGVAAAALLALVVFAAVLAVVGSTIRLALQRRKAEVEVLRLVGASDAFVKGPFLLEGSAQGALGAGAAIGLLAILFSLVRGKLDGQLATLVGIEPSFLPWTIIIGLVAAGAILGGAAASLGLRKLVNV